jgi:tRNA dimethylallyltransferase
MKRNKLIVIFGPTATGKTRLAARLAFRFGGEIISADSRQVYRGMNIGTGKDYEDYVVSGSKIPAHLIDIAEPTEEYNLARFIEDFNRSLSEITERDKLPFLVGGTMLYIHAVLTNYKLAKVSHEPSKTEEYKKQPIEFLRKKLLALNPEQHNTTDLLDKERLIKALLIAETDDAEIISPAKTETLNICILPEREIIYSRIDERLEKRLKSGMIEEVERLIKNGVNYDKLDFFGLEYRYVGKYLRGELNYNDMKQKLASAIKKFAKRQITWIRKIQKEGIEINFLNSPDEKISAELIREFISDD